MAVYDQDIRCALIKSFRTIPEYQTDTIIINEFDVCGGISRVDVAVVNGQLHGYEIKSERDNLERLPSQIDSYNLVFDTMTVVVSKNHIDKIKDMVPKWWGVQYVTGTADKLTLHTKRKARPNKAVDAFRVAQLLWRDELIAILDQNTAIKHAYRSKTQCALATLAAQAFPAKELEGYVRECLKARKDWKSVPVTSQCDDWCNM